MNTEQLFRVDGMVAVVTGGGSGIGLTMSKALLWAGASKVYILGRSTSLLEETALEWNNVTMPGEQGKPGCPEGKMIAITCDVSSKPSIQSAVDRIKEETGYINLLVANSGIAGPMGRMNPDEVSSSASSSSSSPSESSRLFSLLCPLEAMRRRLFEDVSMEDFTECFHVNVTGAYFTMLGFLGLLDAGNNRRGGVGEEKVQSQVIFTSSIAAFSRDRASAPAYAGSKAAIAHLTKHASTNLSRFGIRVNALAPGLFPSAIAQSLIGDRDPSTETHENRLFIPARRFGGTQDIGGTILYLASKAGAYCNGMILVVDGGRLSVMPSTY